MMGLYNLFYTSVKCQPSSSQSYIFVRKFPWWNKPTFCWYRRTNPCFYYLIHYLIYAYVHTMFWRRDIHTCHWFSECMLLSRLEPIISSCQLVQIFCKGSFLGNSMTWWQLKYQLVIPSQYHMFHLQATC